MTTLKILGWERGFQKIEFTKALRRELNLSLQDAKSKTDAILKTQPVELHVQDSDLVRIEHLLKQLGAKLAI